MSGAPLTHAKAGITQLLDRMHFSAQNDSDNVGLVTFDDGPTCGNFPLSPDAAGFRNALANTLGGRNTILEPAFKLAFDYIKRNERTRDALPVIILFSDFQLQDDLDLPEWVALTNKVIAAGIRVITIGLDSDPNDPDFSLMDQMLKIASSPQDVYTLTDSSDIGEVLSSITLPTCYDVTRRPVVFAYDDLTVNHDSASLVGKVSSGGLPTV